MFFKFVIVEGSRLRKKLIYFVFDRFVQLYFEVVMVEGTVCVERFFRNTKNFTEMVFMRGYVFEQYAVFWLIRSDIELSVRMLEGLSGFVSLKWAKRKVKVYEELSEMLDMGADIYKYSICGDFLIRRMRFLIF